MFGNGICSNCNVCCQTFKLRFYTWFEYTYMIIACFVILFTISFTQETIAQIGEIVRGRKNIFWVIRIFKDINHQRGSRFFSPFKSRYFCLIKNSVSFHFSPHEFKHCHTPFDIRMVVIFLLINCTVELVWELVYLLAFIASTKWQSSVCSLLTK